MRSIISAAFNCVSWSSSSTVSVNSPSFTASFVTVALDKSGSPPQYQGRVVTFSQFTPAGTLTTHIWQFQPQPVCSSQQYQGTHNTSIVSEGADCVAAEMTPSGPDSDR